MSYKALGGCMSAHPEKLASNIVHCVTMPCAEPLEGVQKGLSLLERHEESVLGLPFASLAHLPGRRMWLLLAVVEAWDARTVHPRVGIGNSSELCQI